MAKKSTAKNQPIESDETPPQPDDLILDTNIVTSRDRIERAKARQAERRARTTGGRGSGGRSSSAARAANPYSMRTARERRAERGEGGTSELSQERIAELLHNPTKQVSPEQLERDYAYVLRDLRKMGVLAATLVVVLVALALLLPV